MFLMNFFYKTNIEKTLNTQTKSGYVYESLCFPRLSYKWRKPTWTKCTEVISLHKKSFQFPQQYFDTWYPICSTSTIKLCMLPPSFLWNMLKKCKALFYVKTYVIRFVSYPKTKISPHLKTNHMQRACKYTYLDNNITYTYRWFNLLCRWYTF